MTGARTGQQCRKPGRTGREDVIGQVFVPLMVVLLSYVIRNKDSERTFTCQAAGRI